RNKCENCHSVYALEIDHRIPRALGGTNDAPNLRLLCRSCNQRAAIQVFGLRKMGNNGARQELARCPLPDRITNHPLRLREPSLNNW
ncbi:MAG: HNH endonuclease, partial [Bdellovibrionales bacterium]|nr:HNH endonuclease [Bdellovibrionales bacterium]